MNAALTRVAVWCSQGTLSEMIWNFPPPYFQYEDTSLFTPALQIPTSQHSHDLFKELPFPTHPDTAASAITAKPFAPGLAIVPCYLLAAADTSYLPPS